MLIYVSVRREPVYQCCAPAHLVFEFLFNDMSIPVSFWVIFVRKNEKGQKNLYRRGKERNREGWEERQMTVQKKKIH